MTGQGRAGQGGEAEGIYFLDNMVSCILTVIPFFLIHQVGRGSLS